jgi:hypothetical protein
VLGIAVAHAGLHAGEQANSLASTTSVLQTVSLLQLPCMHCEQWLAAVTAGTSTSCIVEAPYWTAMRSNHVQLTALALPNHPLDSADSVCPGSRCCSST